VQSVQNKYEAVSTPLRRWARGGKSTYFLAKFEILRSVVSLILWYGVLCPCLLDVSCTTFLNRPGVQEQWFAANLDSLTKTATDAEGARASEMIRSSANGGALLARSERALGVGSTGLAWLAWWCDAESGAVIQGLPRYLLRTPVEVNHDSHLVKICNPWGEPASSCYE
jgi:hypothetical protein